MNRAEVTASREDVQPRMLLADFLVTYRPGSSVALGALLLAAMAADRWIW